MRIAVSKIRQPRKKAQVIKRVRLTDLLHENIHRKLTFVCAPGGFGKTTLLSDFADDVDAAICWYQIGSGESNLGLFFLYLVSAVQHKYPEFGKELPGLVSKNNTADLDILAIDFVNALVAEIHEFTILILDDYHLASQTPEIVLFLEKVLELLPEHVRLLIGSRNIYGIPSAELYIKSELSTISAEVLAFQTDELLDLAKNYFQIKLERDQAEKIIGQTEGWIMGILLALRDKDMLGSIANLSGSREDIFRFFYEEIIQALDEPLVEFLMVTSLFEEFDETLCHALMPEAPVGELIRQLFEQNLFISQVDLEGEPAYQYHQLFRGYLIDQRSSYLPTDKLKSLQMLGAEHLSAHQAFEPAIDLLLDAGDVPAALELMNTHAVELYLAGQHSTLQNWVRGLKDVDEIEQAAPELMLNYAKAISSQGKNAETLVIYQKLEPVFRKKKDLVNLVNLLVNKGILLSFALNYEAAQQHGIEALDLIEKSDAEPFYKHQAQRLVGLSACLLRNEIEGLEWLNKAAAGIRGLMTRGHDPRFAHELVQILADIGYFALQSGDIFNAEKSYDEAVQVAKNMPGHQGDLALAANNQAYALHLTGDFQSSWKKYELALEAGLTAAWKRIVVNTLNGRGDLLRDLGLLNEAEDEYRQALSYKESAEPDFTLGTTYRGLAEVERERKRYNKATTLIREAAQWEKSDINSTPYLIQQAHIWLDMGQVELATGQLENVLTELDQKAYSPIRSRAYFLRGLCATKGGNPDEATSYYKKALQDAAQLGYDQYLFQLVRENASSIRQANERDPLPQMEDVLNRAAKLNWEFDWLSQQHASETKAGIDRLQIQGFEQGQVRVNGERIPDMQWKSSGARALFFYILETGGASKEQIALDFWPDFSVGKINSNFHATLWRVRNALGSRDLIAFDGREYSLPQEIVDDYDVRRFEELAARLQKETEHSPEFRNTAYLMLDIYAGDFLPDIDMLWIDDRRMELAGKYQSTLEKLAGLEFKEGHYENARRLYEKLIERDRYTEEYQIGYLSSMLALQDRSGAKRHYEDYATQLEIEMGLQPGEELSQIYSNHLI
jgi:ATP/maltotriose-dependent transcriptional regulator MalT